jgi:hypothetical protein
LGKRQAVAGKCHIYVSDLFTSLCELKCPASGGAFILMGDFRQKSCRRLFKVGAATFGFSIGCILYANAMGTSTQKYDGYQSGKN